MKINPTSFAFAGAITAAILWTVCALLVWMMPGSMMNTTGSMVHMDMNSSGWVLTPMGFIWGLVVWSIFTGVFAWLLAFIYNRLTGSTNSQ